MQQPDTLSPGSLALQLLNTLLGSGVLGLPYCFRSAGLALGGTLLFGCCAATVSGAVLLLNSAHITGCRTYSSLAHTVLGPWAAVVAGGCTAALQLGEAARLAVHSPLRSPRPCRLSGGRR